MFSILACMNENLERAVVDCWQSESEKCFIEAFFAVPEPTPIRLRERTNEYMEASAMSRFVVHVEVNIRQEEENED